MQRKLFATLVAGLVVLTFTAFGVLTADAAQPSFTAVVNALNQVPAGGGLRATTCPSASYCVAVGWDANDAPVVLAGDPSTWSIAEAKEITLGASFGALPYTANTLSSVTCSSTTWCVAVGGDMNDRPIVLAGDPATWGAAQVHEIAIGTADLRSVACTSSTSCVAVGAAGNGLFVLTGDPSTWGAGQAKRIMLGSAFGRGYGNYLSSVSCSSPTACVAVGEDSNSEPLVLAGDPSTWGVAQAKEIALGDSLGVPQYPAANSLLSVACSSSTSCVAVGEDANIQPLVLAGNPSTWGVAQAKEIALYPTSFGGVGPYAGEGHDVLESVMCSSSTSCIAMGFDGHRQPLELTGNPSTWSAAQAQEIVLRDSFGFRGWYANTLLSLACSSSTSCVAVGYDPNLQPLELVGDPSTWSDAQAREIPLAGAAFGAIVIPSALSCVSATSCFDVGWDYDHPSLSEEQGPYLMHGNPSTWDQANVTVMPQLPGPLSAITCWSSTSCVAIGPSGWSLGLPSRRRGPNGTFQGRDGYGPGVFFLKGNPSTWSTARGRRVPLPGHPGLGADAFIYSGTCTSPTFCVAVGTSENDQALVIAGNPSTVTAADSREVTSSGGVLYSVACASQTRCVAVGVQGRQPLVLTGNPATWHSAQARVITLGNNLGASGKLRSVACPSATYCVAVGVSGPKGRPLVLAGNPLAWSANSAFGLRASPATASTVQGFVVHPPSGESLTSISCKSTAYCVVVAADASGAPLYLTGNPANWRGRLLSRPTQDAPSFMTAGLNTSACAPVACFAGGRSNGGDFVATLG